MNQIILMKHNLGNSTIIPIAKLIWNYNLSSQNITNGFIEDIFSSKLTIEQIFSEFLSLFAISKKYKKEEKAREEENKTPEEIEAEELEKDFNFMQDSFFEKDIKKQAIQNLQGQSPPSSLNSILGFFYSKINFVVEEFVTLPHEKLSERFLEKVKSTMDEPLGFLIVPTLERAFSVSFNEKINLCNKIIFFQKFREETLARCKIKIQQQPVSPISPTQVNLSSKVEKALSQLAKRNPKTEHSSKQGYQFLPFEGIKEEIK